MVFYLAAHRTENDYYGLIDELARATHYISENLGWNEKTCKMYEMIVQGGDEALDYQLEPHRIGEAKLLFGSKKKIAFIDLPYNHPLLADYRVYDDLLQTSMVSFFDGKFTVAYEQHVRGSKLKARFQKARQEYMIAELNTLLGQIRKGVLLVPLGQFHLNVAKAFDGNGETRIVRQLEELDSSSVITSLQMEEEEVSRDLHARVFLEMTLIGNYGRMINDTIDLYRLMNILSDGITYEDVSALSEALGKAKESDDPKAMTRVIVDFFRRVKGIELPQDITEVVEFLGTHSEAFRKDFRLELDTCDLVASTGKYNHFITVTRKGVRGGSRPVHQYHEMKFVEGLRDQFPPDTFEHWLRNYTDRQHLANALGKPFIVADRMDYEEAGIITRISEPMFPESMSDKERRSHPAHMMYFFGDGIAFRKCEKAKMYKYLYARKR